MATVTASSITLAGLKLGGAVAKPSNSSSCSVRGGVLALCSSTLCQSSRAPCASTCTCAPGGTLVFQRNQGGSGSCRVAGAHSPSTSYPHQVQHQHQRQRNGFPGGQGVFMGGTRSATAAGAVATGTSEASQVEVSQWTWNNEGSRIVVHVREYGQNAPNSTQTVLMLPTLSDVSTTDEWQAVAEGLLTSPGGEKFKVITVDWPGLGLSERPPINYTADALERFLADFVSSFPGLKGSSADNLPVIVGGGHSATIAARALSKGLLQAKALVAVAPTWAGPLPIVFGRDSKMEFRYSLLRNTLRSPGIGWAMYKYLVSSEKNIRMQYLNHVYADANNVTPAVVENRTNLTRRDGARFAPAAFLTGLLDPTTSREEFLGLFSKLDGTVSTLVMSTAKAPRRSRAEMEALDGAVGVTQFVTVPGALLPHEEYPDIVTEKLSAFLQE